MLTFDAPQYFFLLLLVPLTWLIRYWYRHRGSVIPFSFQSWGDQKEYLNSFFLDILLGIERSLFWLGVIFLIIALTGPVRVSRRENFANRGMDIMVVLDTSPSMAAMDFGVENRLETAKNMLEPFVKTRENDSFGLVRFSSEAQLLMPPTVDYSLFLKELEAMKIAGGNQGTAIGMGVALGILHLSTSEAERKILLLLTDGENNAGEISPETAVSMARQLGIVIYTIGIGTTGEIQLEYSDPLTGEIISGLFESRFDEELLKNMAKETGGEYYRAISSATLSSIFRNIDSKETGERLTRLRVEKEYLHRWFILIGLILVLTALFLRRILLGEIL